MKDKTLVSCPVCNSDNVTPARLSAMPFALLYLIGIPLILPFRSHKRHCFECGADFRTGARTEIPVR